MSKFIQKDFNFQNNFQVRLREATSLDAACVMNIGKHLMEDGEGQVIEGDEFTFNVEHEKKWIQDHFSSNSDIIIIAELIERDCKKIIGILNFETKKRRRISHTGEFGMGLHKDFRGIGIGKTLIKEFIKWTKNNPVVEKVNLRVLENNTKAISIYKKLGFVEDGRKTKEVKISPGKYLDDISMELIL